MRPDARAVLRYAVLCCILVWCVVRCYAVLRCAVLEGQAVGPAARVGRPFSNSLDAASGAAPAAGSWIMGSAAPLAARNPPGAGLLAALVLTACGASKEEIVADYAR